MEETENKIYNWMKDKKKIYDKEKESFWGK